MDYILIPPHFYHAQFDTTLRGREAAVALAEAEQRSKRDDKYAREEEDMRKRRAAAEVRVNHLEAHAIA